MDDDSELIQKILKEKKISPQQLDCIKESFAFFDKNGDGTISLDEFKAAFSKIGQEWNVDDLTELMKHADSDGDGSIDFIEFLHMISDAINESNEHPSANSFLRMHKSNEISDNIYRQAFKIFDRDGDGYISRRELSILMNSIGEIITDEELDEMMHEADCNGDGLVDFIEFKNILK